ncbi:mitochondrial ribosomal protein subunit-domain-containing protein [Fomitopsis betulina]|nr:mitochondrial ribosomal protein subunit-domain-containing protein [Fomitopsis betulina]
MSTQAPSHFANLLRQSRFASFDPAIGNVYASYGGHAHRGNWGLKRPLPLRRRKGNVRVQAIDSIAQQTEWAPAESQARWIQMWEEVGITPKTSDGSWMDKLGTTGLYRWEVDSEFAPVPMPASRLEKAEKSRHTQEAKDKDEEENSSEAIPNIYSMTEREFERYLEKLREMRPAFLEHLEKRTTPTDDGSRLWKYRKSIEGDHHKRFLMAQAGQEYRSHDSRIIEQKPQRYGGLVYSPQSSLQSKLTTEAMPGRIIERAFSHNQNSGDYVTGFAGMAAHLHKSNSQNRAPLNWRSLGGSTDAPDAMRGIAPMRMAYARLISAPGTAQQPRDLRTVRMQMEVYVTPEIEHGAQNPYPPGSREYVGYEDAPQRSMMQRAAHKKSKPQVAADWTVPKQSGNALLTTLGNMLDTHLPVKPDQF